MPFDTLDIRISLQKLLIGLILVIVPLSFVGLYLASEADKSLEHTIGTHFRSIAQADGVRFFLPHPALQHEWPSGHTRKATHQFNSSTTRVGENHSSKSIRTVSSCFPK